MNTLRHIAFNVLKSDASANGGISYRQYGCAIDPSYLDTMLSVRVRS